MKNTLLFIVSLAPFIITGQTQSDDILGTWLNEDENGQIEIYQDGEKYFGKIITAKPPKNVNEKAEDALDKNNPNPDLRSQPILGLVVLKNLKFQEKEWIDGTAYSPENGKEYKVKIWMSGKDKLKLRGYVGFFCSTETWTRVK